MGRAYPADDLAKRVFTIVVVGVGAEIAVMLLLGLAT